MAEPSPQPSPQPGSDTTARPDPQASPHLAVVVAAPSPSVGRHVRQLAEGLLARGWRVSVFAPAAVHRQFNLPPIGVRAVAVEVAAEPSPRDLGSVTRLRQALRQPDIVPVDLVHAHGLRAGLVATWAKPAGTPLVVTWHSPVLGDGPRARTLRLTERIVARGAEVTLCVSEDLLARASELGARDARLAVLAAPGPPPAGGPGRPLSGNGELVRTELGLGERPLVLAAGQLHPQKGYSTLVEAAARWRGRDPVPLVAIAGTGPAYRSLAGQILTSRAPVRLLGHRDDVPDLLRAAQVAVVTSRWEGRPMFVQEALAAGVAVVATAVGGLPGLVGDAAWLVAPGDIDALDAAVTTLLADSGLRVRYATAGLSRAAQLPTALDAVDQVLSVYAHLLRGAAPRAASTG